MNKEVVVQKSKSKYPLAEAFLYLLKEDTSTRNGEIAIIYFQLFSILSLKTLNNLLKDYKRIYLGKDDYFKETGRTEWFTIFHKSIRQTDFYDRCYREDQIDVFNKNERQEYRYLQHKVRQQGYDKTDKEGKRLFNDEYRRYLDLYDMKKGEDRQTSISGKLDSILWNVIHLDKKDYLYNLMKDFFDIKK